MMRKIIKIDQEKCNGCAVCAQACEEGAIVMSNGKAALLRDDYCDGLGNCLPACPTGAISFEERIAAPFDLAAVKIHMQNRAEKQAASQQQSTCSGCPGSQAHQMTRQYRQNSVSPSCLTQWPVQIQLVPANAHYLQGADLLIAADCAAYAYGNFHEEFIKGRVTLIGCPKLDRVDYKERIGQIFAVNAIASVTTARMEVPCCAGLAEAVRAALSATNQNIPLQVVTISTDGRILES